MVATLLSKATLPSRVTITKALRYLPFRRYLVPALMRAEIGMPPQMFRREIGY